LSPAGPKTRSDIAGGRTERPVAEPPIHPHTRLGHVHLTVADLDRAIGFYREVLGFKLHRREDDTAHLGAGGADLVVLTERLRARRIGGRSGLYHFAVLVPSRLALAQILRCITQTRTPVEGMVDHWISEAIYLPDPDGNGIEVACDRPREQWPSLETLAIRGNGPLDIDGLFNELARADGPWVGLGPRTVIGHVHLHVASISEAEAFYCGVLGFERMMRYGPSAGFVAAGGYHHHIGFNTWAGIGAPPPPPDAAGLQHFVVRLPCEIEQERVLQRVRRAGLGIAEIESGFLVRDPSQNGVLLTASSKTDGLATEDLPAPRSLTQ